VTILLTFRFDYRRDRPWRYLHCTRYCNYKHLWHEDSRP